MGKSVAIKFTIEMHVRDEAGDLFHCTPAEWRVRARFRGMLPGYGKPTDENLAKYIQGFQAATLPGQPNAHLGVCTVVSAEIKDQETRTVVATYRAAPNSAPTDETPPESGVRPCRSI